MPNPEYFITASTLHVDRPRPAGVRVFTCPEREVLLDISVMDTLTGVDQSISVELNTQEAREVIAHLTEILRVVEARKPKTAFERIAEEEA